MNCTEHNQQELEARQQMEKELLGLRMDVEALAWIDEADTWLLGFEYVIKTLDAIQQTYAIKLLPRYKVNCADCGAYVRESEHPGMVTVCGRCNEAQQREMQGAL